MALNLWLISCCFGKSVIHNGVKVKSPMPRSLSVTWFLKLGILPLLWVIATEEKVQAGCGNHVDHLVSRKHRHYGDTPTLPAKPFHGCQGPSCQQSPLAPLPSQPQVDPGSLRFMDALPLTQPLTDPAAVSSLVCQIVVFSSDGEPLSLLDPPR